MAQGTLKEILGIEKEIKERRDRERAKARQWLERSRTETEAAKRDRIAELESAANRAKEQSKRAAEARAAEIIGQARCLAERIEALDDDVLQQIVRKHLAEIVPGERA